MIAKRDGEISGFVKSKSYSMELDFGDFLASSEKFSSREEAKKVLEQCSGQPVVAESVKKQQSKENPPTLYDLTTLQREANRHCGFTAEQMLGYLQNLYERKIASYPRTSSKYLPEDMGDTAKNVVSAVLEALPFAREASLNPNIGQILDNSKVQDHFALIPTIGISSLRLDELPSGELKILEMISCRLLCAVSTPCTSEKLEVRLECAGFPYMTISRPNMV
jgi:DNA topoisomerase-3